jgi:S-DNA-T family DNA segregation ATPase FtsK/SpoIIIE
VPDDTLAVDGSEIGSGSIADLCRSVGRRLSEAESDRVRKRALAEKTYEESVQAGGAAVERAEKSREDRSSILEGLLHEANELFDERKFDPTFQNLRGRLRHALSHWTLDEDESLDGMEDYNSAYGLLNDLKRSPQKSTAGCSLTILGVAIYGLCWFLLVMAVTDFGAKSEDEIVEPAAAVVLFYFLGLFPILGIGIPVWISRARRKRHYPTLDAFATRVLAFQRWIEVDREAADRERTEASLDAKRERKRAFEKADEECRKILDDTLPLLERVALAADRHAPSISDPVWNQVSLETSAAWIPRLGENVVPILDRQVGIPFLLPFPFSKPIVLYAGGVDEAPVVGVLQRLMLRLAVSVPPGKLRFALFDPIGLGQNAAPILPLGDKGNADLITGRVWSEPAHIEQRLADLSEHVENVIQKYLRNEFTTITDYNARAGEVTEAYRVVVAFNVPTGLTETSFRRLISLSQHGARCGVFVVAVVDPQGKVPYGVALKDLDRAALVLAKNDKGEWRSSDPDYQGVIRWEEHSDLKVWDDWLNSVATAAAGAGPVQVPFERIATPEAEWWTADSRKGLMVALGRRGARETQYLQVGKGTAQHALIAGKPGSGKSTLLHALITGLALSYSPDELELYLIDFKKGVEFKAYAEHLLPHARVIAVESEREFGASVLQGLDAELTRRGEAFRAAGTNEISSFRDRKGLVLSRIVLIVDEFQEFFTEDDAIAAKSAQVLDRLVRQGRAFGIHVILGSQTLGGAYTLAKSTMDQMHVRIALQCSETDSRLILADDNPAARLLARPGEAIYNAANGRVEGNENFQIAWLDEDERNASLVRLHDRAGPWNRRRPIVFEGNAPADLAENDKLRAAALAAAAGPPCVWIGDPIAIADPVEVRFTRMAGGNLLLVGREGPTAIGLLASVLCGLAAGEAEQILVVDFGVDDAPEGPESALSIAGAAAMLGGAVRTVSRRKLPDVLAALAGEVDRRTELENYRSPARFLLVNGLQRARDLRHEESAGFGFSLEPETAGSSPAQDFSSIVQHGPEVGVHVVVSCDSARNVSRSLDRKTLEDFGYRVVLQMGADESATLIDSPAASKLGSNRALLLDDEQGRLVKLRPYGVPAVEWVAEFSGRLRDRDRAAPATEEGGQSWDRQ